MPAYVRVRKLTELRDCIDALGTQTDVAAAAQLSLQRVNQLYTGTSTVVEVRKAARLEDVLGLPRGSLFEALDRELLMPYMADELAAQLASELAAGCPLVTELDQLSNGHHLVAELATAHLFDPPAVPEYGRA
jgi:hypothetical protein